MPQSPDIATLLRWPKSAPPSVCVHAIVWWVCGTLGGQTVHIRYHCPFRWDAPGLNKGDFKRSCRCNTMRQTLKAASLIYIVVRLVQRRAVSGEECTETDILGDYGRERNRLCNAIRSSSEWFNDSTLRWAADWAVFNVSLIDDFRRRKKTGEIIRKSKAPAPR